MTFLSLLTILGQLIWVTLVTWIAVRVLRGKRALPAPLYTWIMPAMFIVALAATLGSLYFSEILEYLPCKECWIQRIFMYPLVILLAIALVKRDAKVARYVLALCIIGIGFSLYQYTRQWITELYPPTDTVPCDLSGADCATASFFQFNYITIPLMAATAFALNGLGSLILLGNREPGTQE